MYEVIYTGQFKKSLRLCVRRGLDIQAFTTVLDILQEKGQLPAEYLPHKLSGKYKGFWECQFPGMLKQRRFNVVLITKDAPKPLNLDRSAKGRSQGETPEGKMVQYSGKLVSVQL